VLLGIDERFFSPRPAEPGEPYVLTVGKDLARDYATFVEALAPLGIRLELGVYARNVEGIALPRQARARVVGPAELREIQPGLDLADGALGAFEPESGYADPIATTRGFAAAAERGSEHPLGEAIVRRAQAEQVELASPEEFLAIPGHGIRAKVEGREVVLGNLKLMVDAGMEMSRLAKEAELLAEAAKTPMFVALDGQVIGIIAVADTLKPYAQEALTAFHRLGLEVVMMTGDNRRTAQAIARQVGIERVLAEVLPQAKAAEVKQLQAEGKVVAMVGDGINDAPALAQADVGMAIGTGTDVAIEASDITLIAGDLRGVVTAIALSKRTMRTMKQNFFWALIYNTMLIPVAAGALYPVAGILMSPIIAGAAMAFSSVSVVANSLRLRRFRPQAVTASYGHAPMPREGA
jgi:Cu+-exporting ATPase